jgi:N-acetylglucosaminyldiphosphoundecaprenol N-acetyl-beta-D-mannosaminyltransferase
VTGGSARRRVTLFGLQIDCLTLDDTVDLVEQFVRAGSLHQQVSVNVDKAVKASHDPALRDLINRSDLVNADGAPIVWASRLLGRAVPERVSGIDLMLALIARAERVGHRVYFLGARPDVVRALVARLGREHPRLAIAGARDGYWRPDEEADVVRGIAAARPDIVFIALPSPRKEAFIDAWGERMGAPFVMGVGGSFDVYAGHVRRAPGWLQRLGGEWLFRLVQEPRRMWRRYLVDDMQFVPLLLRELLRRRR